VFAAALVSIVPLVGLIGDATERLAARLGPTLGGLFNSTLNNLPELIIGGVALANGLAPVVKASLTGAILANLLVSLGVTLIAGGIRHGEQRFDPRRLAVNGSMLMICAFCFIVPAMFSIGTPDGTREMSFVLIGMYAMNVAVTCFGGAGGTNLPDDQGIDDEHAATPVWRGLPRRGDGGALACPRADRPAAGPVEHVQRARAARGRGQPRGGALGLPLRPSR
jgi:hypothetical protein